MAWPHRPHSRLPLILVTLLPPFRLACRNTQGVWDMVLDGRKRLEDTDQQVRAGRQSDASTCAASLCAALLSLVAEQRECIQAGLLPSARALPGALQISAAAGPRVLPPGWLPSQSGCTLALCPRRSRK